MMRPGARNLITDVPGLRVGNASDPRLKSGVTVLTADRPFVAGVDVRGGGPGTRETDLLAPGRMVQAVDALVLSGGSAFGLDAAAGVMDRLRDQGRGALAAGWRVPIVPAAILFDLANGGDKDWAANPYPALGAAAFDAAAEDFEIGSAGAGTGAMTATVMGGLGSASLVLEDGATVGALVAVNAFGTVLLPDSRAFWAGPFEIGDEFGGLGGVAARVPPATPRPQKPGRRPGQQHHHRRRRHRRRPRQGRRRPPRRGRPGRPRPGDLPGAHVVRRRPDLRPFHRRPAGRATARHAGSRARRRALPHPRRRPRRPRRPPGARQPAALLERAGRGLTRKPLR